MALVSDCVSSAEAYPSVGEEVDHHRQPPPTCQGGSDPLLHQAVGCSGFSPESSQHHPGDREQVHSQRPQIPEEWGDSHGPLSHPSPSTPFLFCVCHYEFIRIQSCLRAHSVRWHGVPPLSAVCFISTHNISNNLELYSIAQRYLALKETRRASP